MRLYRGLPGFCICRGCLCITPECDDEIGRQRFCVMEKRLFWRIMTPAATAAVALGLALLGFEYRGNWIIIKIILVLALLAYHAYCGVLLSRFAAGKNPHRSLFLRLFNEIPALLLLLIVGLVVFKPFNKCLASYTTPSTMRFFMPLGLWPRCLAHVLLFSAEHVFTTGELIRHYLCW